MAYTRIRELREKNNLTQAELAQYLNCSVKTYSRYENEKCKTFIIIKLADFYNTSVDYILDLTDNPIPYER